jgi:hypothetical protein
MMSTNRLFSLGRLSTLVAAAVLISGCTVSEVNRPTPVGVSELGIGVSLFAEPEFLPRDGSSMSRITVRTYDESGNPKGGQHVHLEVNAGTLSATEVTTTADGSAVFNYIAPGINENVQLVRISATPITNQNLQNANPRFVDILVSGPDIPIASFNFNPAAPAQFQQVSFDASTTFLSGRACGSACSYAWDFGDGSSDGGRPRPARPHRSAGRSWSASRLRRRQRCRSRRRTRLRRRSSTSTPRRLRRSTAPPTSSTGGTSAAPRATADSRRPGR